MHGARVPVLLIVHRRPEQLKRVFECVRAARPNELFIAVDVPGDESHLRDHHEAVEVATAVDWPCTVRIDTGDRPLGCSARITTAIDWAFEHCDRLLVIEDDIVFDPSFVDWASVMLDRYESDPTVGQVGGRNELIRWPSSSVARDASGGCDALDAMVDDGVGHLLVRRGSVWGWATWREVWQRHRSGALSLPSQGTDLLDEHARLMVTPPGTSLVWDVEWSRSLIASGLRSVIPEANLVDNIGFHVDATHTTEPNDVRAGFPIGSSVPDLDDAAWSNSRIPMTNDTYDTASLLIELMSTYRQPGALARLARLSQRGSAPAMDEATLHHLVPFRESDLSIRALNHLQIHGADAHRFTAIEDAVRAVIDAERRT